MVINLCLRVNVVGAIRASLIHPGLRFALALLQLTYLDCASGAKRLLATPIFGGPGPGRHYCLCTASTNPNPKVRKGGAVGKAVLASMVLEEGSIRDARGDSSSDIRIHREPRGWKSCVVRGAPFSLYGLFFGRSFGKVIKAQGGPRWCRGWWSIVSKSRLTANNIEQKWCLTRGSPDAFHNACSLRR